MPGSLSEVPRRTALVLIAQQGLERERPFFAPLREAGYDLEVVQDGSEAYRRARALQPDLLISEVLLPQMDGLALCRAIRSDPQTRSMPVLLCSVLAAEDRAQEAGASGFLRGPSGPDQLVHTVRQLLTHGTSSRSSGDQPGYCRRTHAG
ncbi:MAG: response regulator [Armatimonadetes bacterium]|nr:response regulator [Armatimonadota bacterium]